MTQLPKSNFQWRNFLGGGLLLYAAGLFLLWRGIIVIGIGLYQTRFVETTAVVIESDAWVSSSDDRATNYKFEYKFSVNDTPYTSRRFSAGLLSLNEREGVKRFKAGERITIFYSANNPNYAVVERRLPTPFVYFGVGLGCLFIWMATGLTFYGHVGGLSERRLAQRERQYAEFGRRFQTREAESYSIIVPEIIQQMPRPLNRTLVRYIKNDNQLAGVSYLKNKTNLSQSLCQSILNQMEADM